MKNLTIQRMLLRGSVVAIVAMAGVARAQVPQQSIFDYLAQSQPGKGNVKIVQSDYVRSLVSRRSLLVASTADEGSVMKMRGFRIQVYSGNRPNSRSVATSREAKIRGLMPEVETYVNYEAPFWKLRVGNYTSSLEAEQALISLRRALPEYRREMYVVRDVVLLPQ